MLDETRRFDDFECLEPTMILGYVLLALERARADSETRTDVIQALLTVLHDTTEAEALAAYDRSEY